MNLFQPLPEIERVRRSRPAALTSNQPKGFPVAHKPLRAPSRRVVVITSGTNSFHRCGGPPPSKREVLGDSPVKACGLAVDWI